MKESRLLAVGASLFAALCSLILAVVVVMSISRMETALDYLKDGDESVSKELTEQVFVVRLKSRPVIKIPMRGKSMDEVVAAFEAARQGGEPFKDCWLFEGDEYEVCTPFIDGQEAHDAAVLALQETYENQGPCPGP